MADQVLKLIINGDAKGAVKALGDTAKGVSGTTKAAAAVGAAMVAAGTAISAGMGVATKAATNYGGEVIRIQRMTGASAAESSKFAAILGRYGVTGNKAALVMKSLNTEIASGGDNLKAIGVSVTEADGSYRSHMDVMSDLAEAYRNADDKTAVLQAATKTLGRGFANLLPVLAGGKEGIEKLGKAAQENGLILSDDDLTAIKEYNKLLTDQKEVMKGVEVQVGLATLPFETFKNKAILDTLKGLRDLNPELQQTAGAMGAVAGPALKFTGSIALAIAALPFFAGGLTLVKGGLETVAIKALYAGDALRAFTFAGGGTVGIIVALAGAGVAAAIAIESYNAEARQAAIDTEQWQSRLLTAAESADILANKTGTVTSLHQGYGATVKTAGDDVANYATSHRDAWTAIDKTGDAARDATGKIRNLNLAMRTLQGDNLDAAEALLANKDAHRAVKEAVTAYDKAVRDSGKGSDEAAQAQRDLSQAQIDAGRSDIALTESKAKLRESINKMRDAGMSNSDMLKALGKNGYNAAVKLGLIKPAVDKIPKGKTVKVTAETAAAKSRIESVREQLGNLSDKDVRIRVSATGGGTIRAVVSGQLTQFLVNHQGGIYNRPALTAISETGDTEGIVNMTHLARGDRRQLGILAQMNRVVGGMLGGGVTVQTNITGPVYVRENADIERLSQRTAEANASKLRALGLAGGV